MKSPRSSSHPWIRVPNRGAGESGGIPLSRNRASTELCSSRAKPPSPESGMTTFAWTYWPWPRALPSQAAGPSSTGASLPSRQLASSPPLGAPPQNAVAAVSEARFSKSPRSVGCMSAGGGLSSGGRPGRTPRRRGVDGCRIDAPLDSEATACTPHEGGRTRWEMGGLTADSHRVELTRAGRALPSSSPSWRISAQPWLWRISAHGRAGGAQGRRQSRSTGMSAPRAAMQG